MKRCTRRACKAISFAHQICKFVTFSLPSPLLLLKLHNVVWEGVQRHKGEGAGRVTGWPFEVWIRKCICLNNCVKDRNLRETSFFNRALEAASSPLLVNPGETPQQFWYKMQKGAPINVNQKLMTVAVETFNFIFFGLGFFPRSFDLIFVHIWA